MLNFHGKKILLLAPHLDDLELGMGGVISRITKYRDYQIHYVVFSIPHGVEREKIFKEFERVKSLYDTSQWTFQFEDFDARDLPSKRQEVLQTLIDIRKRYAPDVVFTTNSLDIHQSHNCVYQETIRAFKHVTILGYELPWNSFGFNNHVYIALSESEIETKERAISEYNSQLTRDFFTNGIARDLARLRGKQIGREFAECFEMIRLIS